MGICGSSNNEDPARSSAAPASTSASTAAAAPAPAPSASTAAAAPAPAASTDISAPIRPHSESKAARDANASKPPQPEFAVMWEEVLTELHRESVLIAQRAAAGHKEGSGAVEPPKPEELKKFCEDEKQKFADQRKAAFEKIFAAYDINRDSLLDEKETRALLSDFMRAQRLRAPQEVRELVDMSARVLAKQHSVSYDIVRPQLESVERAMCQKLESGFASLLEHADVLSNQLFHKMDEDRNGRITKLEFLKHYDTAITQLVDTEKMLS